MHWNRVLWHSDLLGFWVNKEKNLFSWVGPKLDQHKSNFQECTELMLTCLKEFDRKNFSPNEIISKSPGAYGISSRDLGIQIAPYETV